MKKFLLFSLVFRFLFCCGGGIVAQPTITIDSLGLFGTYAHIFGHSQSNYGYLNFTIGKNPDSSLAAISLVSGFFQQTAGNFDFFLDRDDTASTWIAIIATDSVGAKDTVLVFLNWMSVNQLFIKTTSPTIDIGNKNSEIPISTFYIYGDSVFVDTIRFALSFTNMQQYGSKLKDFHLVGDTMVVQSDTSLLGLSFGVPAPSAVRQIKIPFNRFLKQNSSYYLVCSADIDTLPVFMLGALIQDVSDIYQTYYVVSPRFSSEPSGLILSQDCNRQLTNASPSLDTQVFERVDTSAWAYLYVGFGVYSRDSFTVYLERSLDSTFQNGVVRVDSLSGALQGGQQTFHFEKWKIINQFFVQNDRSGNTYYFRITKTTNSGSTFSGLVFRKKMDFLPTNMVSFSFDQRTLGITPFQDTCNGKNDYVAKHWIYGSGSVDYVHASLQQFCNTADSIELKHNGISYWLYPDTATFGAYRGTFSTNLVVNDSALLEIEIVGIPGCVLITAFEAYGTGAQGNILLNNYAYIECSFHDAFFVLHEWHDCSPPLPISLTLSGKKLDSQNELTFTARGVANSLLLKKFIEGGDTIVVSPCYQSSIDKDTTFVINDKFPRMIEKYYVEGIDPNGKKTFSNIVEIKREEISFYWNLYPNPSTSEVTIEVNEISRLTIYNIIGQQVLVQELAIGQNKINIETLSFGMYVAKVIYEGEIFSQKLIKE